MGSEILTYIIRLGGMWKNEVTEVTKVAWQPMIAILMLPLLFKSYLVTRTLKMSYRTLEKPLGI